MSRGKFIVVTGPSAAGKTTIVEKLLEQRLPSAVKLITTTTRTPRPGEVDGRDYHFLSREEFERRRDAGEFLEWAENYGRFYGSSGVELDKLLARHPLVLAILDVKGAAAVKSARPETLTVFVDVGSFDEVRRRLEARPGITPEDLAARLKTAHRERQLAATFDRVVINRDGRLAATLKRLEDLLRPYILEFGMK